MTAFCERSRSVRIGIVVSLLLATTAVAQSERPREARMEGRSGPRATILEGLVLGPDGSALEGALVVSSTGERVIAGAGGEFRLPVEVAHGTASVRLTAFARGAGSRVASASVVLDPTSATTLVEPLRLVSSCSAAWLPTFGDQPGTDGEIHALLVHDDGSGPALFVGGAFLSAGGALVNGIARWDGASWTPLGSGVSGTIGPSVSTSVRALAVFDDGGGPALYVGGNFTSAGGTAASMVARWDGTSWSALGSGVNSLVHAMAVHDNGSGPALWVGGEFTQAGGANANRIARWDGEAWAPNGFLGNTVRALAVYDAGGGPELFAGGDFATTLVRYVARCSGTSWLKVGSGTNGAVRALIVHDDGSGAALFAGGSFTSADGAAANRVAKWNGTSWSALGGGTDGAVHALSVHDDGAGPALHAGGVFETAGGSPASGVARWDGTSWSALGGGTTVGELDSSGVPVRALATFDAGGGAALFAAGALTAAGGLAANRIAHWDGSAWSRLGSGLNGDVRALAVFDDGNGPALYVGGTFTTVGAVEARAIARWDGASWSTLGSGLERSPYPELLAVNALVVHDDGSGPALYVGGHFMQAGGLLANNVARWDGASWSAVGGLSSSVLALASDGERLYAGGDFTGAVAQWNGASWSIMGSGMSGGPFGYTAVHALLVSTSGQTPVLCAGGSFSSSGGQELHNVAVWASTFWYPMGSGLDGFVHALAEFDGGGGPAVYAGGSFNAPMGIARWNGASWSGVESGISGSSPTVRALGVHDDGSGPALYAAGFFTAVDGVAARSLARWDGAEWDALGSGLVSYASALATWDDGSGPALLVGGSAIDSGDSYLSTWGLPPDVDPPTLACPDSIFVPDALGGPSGETVHFTVTADDCRDPAPSLACVPPSGSFFPRGTTLVTCTAIDAAGNQATCQFPVTVAFKVRRR